MPINLKFWTWGRKKRSKVEAEPEALPSYEKPAERNIFRFWDGSQTRAVDPLLAHQRFDEHPAFVAGRDVLLATDAEGPPQTLALEKWLDATRQAFGVTAFDPATETGLTIEETLRLYDQFLEYLDALEKKAEPSQSLPSSTGASTSSPSSETTTPPSSEYGPTGTDASCDPPGETPKPLSTA